MKIEQKDTQLQTIGIMGVDRGVGVTHLSIMLGNFIRAKCNKNAAIIEGNNSGAFEELRKCYTNTNKTNQNVSSFCLSGVDYYYKVEKEMIGTLYDQCKDYLIYDFGEINKERTNEFLKCNIKILIGNLNPWNRSKLIAHMESFLAMNYLETIRYVARFGSKDDIRQIRNIYNTNLYAAPFEPDPFLIHGCNFNFLEKLL